MIKRANKPDTPSDIQLQQCLLKKQCFIVVAGAGSGKTTSLIKALKYIDDNHGKLLRQQGKRVACITYTTGAENEINNDVGHDSLFHVSTIHSFLWELIRPFQHDIKRLVLAKISAKQAQLNEESLSWTSRTRQTTKDKNAREIEKFNNISNDISSVREFKYETGSNYIRGVLGHNDVLDIAVDLIESSPLLRSIIAQKYPYFFVDESQDTIPKIVDALKSVANQVKDFCLGFFGDPMQKIYLTGAGAISPEKGWKKIDKPENFRCSTDVLNVINNIRRGGDPLQQEGGRKELVDGVLQPVKGSAVLFVFDVADNKEERIQSVRDFFADTRSDSLWLSPSKDGDLKVLMIEHRMAANRLGFGELFSAFSDRSTDSLKTSFKEGTCWALQTFQRIILPLIDAHNKGEGYKVIELLRMHSPLLQKNILEKNNIVDVLEQMQASVQIIADFINGDTATVKDVLMFIKNTKIFQLDEKIILRLSDTELESIDISENGDEGDERQEKINDVLSRYFSCPAIQLWGYQTYINDESPYSTQHSIKGAEFSRVLVVIDDEEGNSSLYSYEKLFGLRELSDTDREHIANVRDNTLERTRRLLYVCCSRSLKDLGVLLFVSDVRRAVKALEQSKIFEVGCVKVCEDIL